MKVMTIIGTRPEIIKLSRVISELDNHLQHILVHTGQNYDYELNEIFFTEMNIRMPDYFLKAVGSNLAHTIGNVIGKSYDILEKERPDALLLLGDTNSCLAALAAKRLKIPIFHMEAGNRCFDLRVPEEINRKIVDHISDINLTYSEHARRNLLAEGIRPEMVIKTGSPMKEVLYHYMHQIEVSDALKKHDVKKGEYFVVSAHREENVDNKENFVDLLSSLNAITAKYDRPIIFSTHPHTMKRLKDHDADILDSRIHFLKPLGFFDYIKLQMNATCVISDSGTITEESSILGFPAVTIRQAHERPEGMDEGTLIMCGLEQENVLKSIDVVTSQFAESFNKFRIIDDYDVDNVSHKVLRIILSYTDYVNRIVWKKTPSKLNN
jgi:UDP-N-acetylglucosamine 2-epimerase